MQRLTAGALDDAASRADGRASVPTSRAPRSRAAPPPPPARPQSLRGAYPALFAASSVAGLTKAAGIPALVTVGSLLWYTLYGFSVGAARAKYIALAKKDGEKDVEARYSYPNLYVDGNTPHAKAFNCVQRSHQQALETLTQMAVFTAVASAVFPVAAGLNMACWWYGRFVWATGYAESGGDASKRYDHPLAFMAMATVLGQFLLAVAAAGEVAGLWAAARALFWETASCGARRREQRERLREAAVDAAFPRPRPRRESRRL